MKNSFRNNIKQSNTIYSEQTKQVSQENAIQSNPRKPRFVSGTCIFKDECEFSNLVRVFKKSFVKPTFFTVSIVLSFGDDYNFHILALVRQNLKVPIYMYLFLFKTPFPSYFEPSIKQKPFPLGFPLYNIVSLLTNSVVSLSILKNLNV